MTRHRLVSLSRLLAALVFAGFLVSFVICLAVSRSSPEWLTLSVFLSFVLCHRLHSISERKEG